MAAAYAADVLRLIDFVIGVTFCAHPSQLVVPPAAFTLADACAARPHCV